MELLRSRKSKLSIDLAPLIDVVFQLLVFFMLTSTFANPAIKLELPKAVVGDTSEIEYLNISIDSKGNVFINDELVELSLFEARLSDLIREYKTTTVHIHGDQNMAYKHFIHIMDLSKQAGAEQINIVHEKSEDHPQN